MNEITKPQPQETDPVWQLRQLLAGTKKALPIPGCPRLTMLTEALTPGTLTIVAGSPGAGKGFFTARTAYERSRQGQPVHVMPLEDQRADFLQRALAIAANSWVVMETDEAGRERRERLLDRHAEDLRQFGEQVDENPRMEVRLEKGTLRVPALPPEQVLARVAEAARPGGLVLIDPLSQIDFPQHKHQEAFVRGLLALLTKSQSMAVLVAHLTKQPRRKNNIYQVEDLQGAAGIGRLCHSALFLVSHEMRKSWVYRESGELEEIDHDKTVHIVKARLGRGQGYRMAYKSRPTSPLMDEMGVLVPQAKIEERQQKATHPVRQGAFSIVRPDAEAGGAHGA